MPNSTSVFPLSLILTSAFVGIAANMLMMLVWRYMSKTQVPVKEMLFISLVVGISIVIWRSVGNIPTLNDDPVPGFSPNDLICPVIAYVGLGIYAGFRQPQDQKQWEQIRAIATLVVLVVNVLTI